MEVVVIKVYQNNLHTEFGNILSSLPYFPFVSMDTEFPGTVHNPDKGVPAYLRSTLSPTEFYKVMKKNVDSLKLIQIGLTLSDAYGNLPTFGTRTQFVWEFNFKDFDLETDSYNEDSISLLQRQGIDFVKNKEDGIDSWRFADLFRRFWPGQYNERPYMAVWVTFHGPYDFGYLIKVLTQGEPLPPDLDGFKEQVKWYFGPQVYDVKMMIREIRLHGGLDRVAKSLNLDRVAGNSHQAGSDSLLTMDVFLELRKWSKNDEKLRRKFYELSHKVYGLTTVS